jgi:multidrug efflux pump subunit AcrB
MNFRQISAWSIRNPVPPIVLFFALTVAGIFSFMRMDVNNDPDIDFPVVWVSISQPGAAPSELETQVTQKVEAAVRSLQGIDQIESNVSEGNSSTTIQLNIGMPIDRAVEDVRSAIQQIRGDLPDGILEPQVGRADTASQSSVGSFTASANDMTLEQLSWYVDNTVAKEVLSVPGVAAVDRNGGVNREIRVTVDPARLQSLGITASQVNQALRSQNLNAAGGKAEISGSEQSVRVLGNAKNAYALGETQVALGGGRTIKLSSIAKVEDLYAEPTSYARYNGRQVLSFDVSRAKGASDVSVFRESQKKLQELEKRNPSVHFELLEDDSKYAVEQYDSAMEALLEGAALAVIVVFIFLRDFRATMISALAIPLSAIPAFWFMDLMGFTLNQMTLLALSLVAGVLVDDAIVEIENIVRHMRMGKSAYQASIDAADEIGVAVLATTMSIVAVFFPVGLMPGVAGQFFKNFGLSVVASVLMSLAVARMLTPMIAAYFLKAKGHVPHGEGPLMDWYMRTLKWTMRYRWVAILGGAAALALEVGLGYILPQTFQPTRDQDWIVANVEMVPGTTLQDTDKVVRQTADILAHSKYVDTTYERSFVGSGRVSAKLVTKRDLRSDQIQKLLTPQLVAIPDARVTFRSNSGWGGGGRDLTITLGGEDPAVLNDTANKLVDQMAALNTVVAPRVSGDLQAPEIVLKPRLDLAASLGVSTQALSQAIRIATLGDIPQSQAKFSLSDRQIPIRVAMNEDARSKLATIQNLAVPTATGGSVPLNVVADISFGAGPTHIARLNQQRRITIGADLAVDPSTGKPYVSGIAMDKIHDLQIMKNLPSGVSELKVGSAKWQAEMIKNFGIAVVSGIFLVFAVLVLLYRRVMAPFVNLGSLLIAPLGALLVLWVTSNPLSLPVYIGLLMLLGIVAKNSILLIDFALEEMNKGVPTMDAILDAGHKRAQPIVMTTVAMVAGMIPTALSLSGDASWRAPMGLTVIGGLTLSTALTLLIVPASFSLATGLERWIGPKIGRRLLTYRPGDEDGPTGRTIEHRPGGRIGYNPGHPGDEVQPAE